MDVRPPKYKTVMMADDQEKLLPSSEAHEATSEAWHSIDYEQGGEVKRRGILANVRSYLWFIDTFLLFIIAALLMLLLLKDRPESTTTSVAQVGGDYTGTDPQLDTKVVKWEADMSFVPKNTTEFFSDDTLARWKSLMPSGTGFGPPGETFSTTSMTHQLHCLFMMGRIYAGITANTTEGLPEDYHEHFLHCIDYLRQGVMCSGDMAMELHDPSDADDLGPKDGGWNGLHVCKDYTQVIGYLEDQISEGVRVVLPVD
ncbi:hypothetical protein F5Y15DRAFT_381724, partial [Xylariaceae sp. FL0016]